MFTGLEFTVSIVAWEENMAHGRILEHWTTRKFGLKGTKVSKLQVISLISSTTLQHIVISMEKWAERGFWRGREDPSTLLLCMDFFRIDFNICRAAIDRWGLWNMVLLIRLKIHDSTAGGQLNPCVEPNVLNEMVMSSC